MQNKKKIKLAILEDNKISQKHFLEFAKSQSFEISAISENSSQLLDQIKASPPDAFLLDLVIPEEDTFSLIHRLKKLYPDLPIIVCSGLREEHIVEKALKAGCFDYIFKPFEEERLAESVIKAVA